MRSYSGRALFNDDSHDASEFHKIVGALDLSDINQCLYRIDHEERDDGYGFGAYDIPNKGPLVYCGLRGKCIIDLYFL